MEIIGEESLLAYTNDIVILGNTRKDILVTQTISIILAASKKIGLCDNKEKTKFMITSRRDENQSNLKEHNFASEKVENVWVHTYNMFINTYTN